MSCIKQMKNNFLLELLLGIPEKKLFSEIQKKTPQCAMYGFGDYIL